MILKGSCHKDITLTVWDLSIKKYVWRYESENICKQKFRALNLLQYKEIYVPEFCQ